MGRTCVVSGCLNAKGHPAGTIHGFPRETKIREMWIKAVGPSMKKQGNLKISNHGVCSSHFKDENYLTEAGSRMQLKFDAVPYVPLQPLMQSATLNTGITSEAPGIKEIYQGRISAMEKLIALQKKKIKHRDDTIASLRKKLEILELKLEETIDELREESELSNYVRQIYSPNQIELIKEGKVTHWSSLDISNAIGLYAASSRGYQYMRTKLNYPLPHVSTVHRWVSKIHVHPGPILPVFHLLKETFKDAPETQRLCIVAFDEMAIDPKYCYSTAEDKIYGDDKLMTGVYARGLFSNWKQLISFNFGGKLTKDSLFALLELLNSSHCDVRGIVCDLGPKNQGLWKELNVCKVKEGKFISRTSITSPTTGSNIWIFADFPHMLKLLRNHLIDEGLTLPDGTLVNKTLIEDLIEAQKSELKLTFSVTYKHIYARGKQRQRVRPAFQLFSKKVSKAIEMLFPSRKSEAEFFCKVNDFSDLMNVRTANVDVSIYKSAYGMKLCKQQDFLVNFYHYFAGIRCGNRKSGRFPPFQKAILVSIRSLIGIYEDMSQEFRMRYIMTAHLNQDYVENSFGLCRGICGFNFNPTAVEAIQRIKRLIIGKNFHHSNASNNEAEKDNSLLSSDALSLLIRCPQPHASTHSSDLNICHLEEMNEIDAEVSTAEINLEGMTIDHVCEESGCEYVAGFIARHFFEKFPNMRKPLAQQSSGNAGWIRKISDGKLLEPSTLWFNYFKKFEEYFDALYPRNSISKQEGIVAKMSSVLISRFPEIPVEILHYYSRIRIFIRISTLNKQTEARKYKAQEQFYQLSKRPISVEPAAESEPLLMELDTSEQLNPATLNTDCNNGSGLVDELLELLN